MPSPELRTASLAVALAVCLAGCGSASHAARSSTTTVKHTHARPKPRPLRLHAAGSLSLPSAREGTATALFHDTIFVSGGISSAGTSTSTVFRIGPSGRAGAGPSLPGPIHDAAATALGGRLLVFGGGVSEGSNRIVQVLPGAPRLVGTLPQPLSDLDAATIGSTAYVAGGWNGSATNPDIYAVTPSGAASRVGRLALGVRYPAVAALRGRLVIAGGETSAGTPTTAASWFDPRTGRITPLPNLPVATDHAAGAVLNGRFYMLGGLRDGVFTDAILAWQPGQARWRAAGHLPAALADLAAAPFRGGIAVLGGRGNAGPVATGSLLKP